MSLLLSRWSATLRNVRSWMLLVVVSALSWNWEWAFPPAWKPTSHTVMSAFRSHCVSPLPPVALSPSPGVGTSSLEESIMSRISIMSFSSSFYSGWGEYCQGCSLMCGSGLNVHRNMLRFLSCWAQRSTLGLRFLCAWRLDRWLIWGNF